MSTTKGEQAVMMFGAVTIASVLPYMIWASGKEVEKQRREARTEMLSRRPKGWGLPASASTEVRAAFQAKEKRSEKQAGAVAIAVLAGVILFGVVAGKAGGV